MYKLSRLFCFVFVVFFFLSGLNRTIDEAVLLGNSSPGKLPEKRTRMEKKQNKTER